MFSNNNNNNNSNNRNNNNNVLSQGVSQSGITTSQSVTNEDGDSSSEVRIVPDGPVVSNGRAENMAIVGTIHRTIDAYKFAEKRKDEDGMNVARYSLRQAREKALERLSRREDREASDSASTMELRHGIVKADESIRNSGLESVLDTDSGNPDNFVPEPSIFDDVE